MLQYTYLYVVYLNIYNSISNKFMLSLTVDIKTNSMHFTRPYFKMAVRNLLRNNAVVINEEFPRSKP